MIAQFSGENNTLYYKSSGVIPELVKIFTTQVTSNASGVFTVDYTLAGFSRVDDIQVTALVTVGYAANDRAFANLQDNVTTTSCSGYTTKGTGVLIGGNSFVLAANTKVNVRVQGI